MKLIVAADQNFAIGRDNKLLCRIPADMKRFRAITTGHIVVMGRKTYLSIPSRPLPDRTTLVLTSRPQELPEVRCFSALEDFLAFAKNAEEEIFVCGGSSVYEQLLPYCEKALVTRILHEFEADSWFPDLDTLAGWERVNETECVETNGFRIKFVDYVNHGVRGL